MQLIVNLLDITISFLKRELKENKMLIYSWDNSLNISSKSKTKINIKLNI